MTDHVNGYLNGLPECRRFVALKKLKNARDLLGIHFPWDGIYTQNAGALAYYN